MGKNAIVQKNCDEEIQILEGTSEDLEKGNDLRDKKLLFQLIK